MSGQGLSLPLTHTPPLLPIFAPLFVVSTVATSYPRRPVVQSARWVANNTTSVCGALIRTGVPRRYAARHIPELIPPGQIQWPAYPIQQPVPDTETLSSTPLSHSSGFC